MEQHLDLSGVVAMEPPSVLHGEVSSAAIGASAAPGEFPATGPPPGRPVLGPAAATPVTQGLQPLQVPSGDVPVLYTVLSGSPAKLVATDVANRTTIGPAVPLSGITGSWAIVQGLDGRLYIGGYQSGDLYRYDPLTGQTMNLGNPSGDPYIFALCVDPSTGLVWGGTWDTGSLFSYNPSTGALRNYGTVEPGESYARSLAAYGGHVYIGLGSTKPELVDFDSASGTKTILPLQNPTGASGSVGVVQVVARNRLYAQFLGGQLFSIPDDELVSTFGEPASSGVSLQAQGTRVYYVQHNVTAGDGAYGEGWIQAYDLSTNREASVTSPQASFAPYLWGDQAHELWLIHLGTSQAPSTSLVALDARAHLWVCDLSTGAFHFYNLAMPGEPEVIEALGSGPPRTPVLYGAGYLQGDSFRLNSSALGSGAAQETGPGQAEAITSLSGLEYFGTYPGGTIWAYDATKPWQFGPSPLLQVNPTPVATLGHRQIRPAALLPDSEGDLLIGSLPAYGEFGGNLSTYLPSSETLEVTTPVPGQAPIALARGPADTVLGGTTVSGGNPNGTPAPASIDPTLFGFHKALQKLVFSLSPFPKAWAIDALHAQPDGRAIYGIAGPTLFAYDPVARRITAAVSIPKAAAPPPTGANYYDWGRSTNLVLGASGLLYALSARAGGEIVEADPLTLKCQVIVRGGATRLGVDGMGNVYYAAGAKLFALVPEAGLAGTPSPAFAGLSSDVASPGQTVAVIGSNLGGPTAQVVLVPPHGPVALAPLLSWHPAKSAFTVPSVQAGEYAVYLLVRSACGATVASRPAKLTVSPRPLAQKTERRPLAG